MIYELRVYQVAPGRMGDLHDRFRAHTLRLFEKHDIVPVAFFTTEVGPANDHLTYILQFQDMGHRERAWKSFIADEEWQEVSALSNQPGQLLLRISNSILTATDYSPLGGD